jgi:hypothetical protein
MDTPVFKRLVAARPRLRDPLPSKAFARFSQSQQHLRAIRYLTRVLNPKDPAPRLPLREIPWLPAQNPVTLLWTPCTRLKIRILQTQLFD